MGSRAELAARARARRVDEARDHVGQVGLELKNVRIVFAKQLIGVLDIDVRDVPALGEDVDVEELWLQEGERRYQEYPPGRITTKPAEAVFEALGEQRRAWGVL